MKEGQAEEAQRALIERAMSQMVKQTGESIAEMLVALANSIADEGGSPSFVRGVSFAAEAVRETVNGL